MIIRNAYSYDFGGAERFPIFLSESLKINGFDTVIVSRSPKLLEYAKLKKVKTIKGWWWSRQNWSGYRIALTPIYFLWQITLTIWYIVLVIKQSPDVLHIQSKDDFIAGTVAGKLLGKKVIWTDHADLKHVWKNLNIWYKNPVGKMVYLASLIADKIVATSKSEEKKILSNLSQNSILKKKFELVYNGSQDKLNSYAINRNKKYTYIFAGRLVTDKGINEIIEAFNKLSLNNNDVQLQILGDGPESDYFKGKAKNNDNIHFFGHISDPYQYMINADVFVYPSYHEAFGISLVEASMLKMPIIASRVGGIPEIIVDNKSGILVDAKKVDPLYEAMKKLYEDRNLAKSLSVNARKRFKEKFNFDDIVKNEYIPIYKGER